MVLAPNKMAYPRRIPAKVAIVLLSTYLLTRPFDQIIEGIEELRYAIKIEIAAPTIPYSGTNVIKEIKNATNWTQPIMIIFRESFELLNFEIEFMTIIEGKIPTDKINKAVPPGVYSGPSIERMYEGTTARAVIIGEVRLNPIRKLPSVRSDFASDEAGMTE